MACYDFPDMVVHEDGCPYTRGEICFPRPSSEAPAFVVETYVKGRHFYLTGEQPNVEGEKFERIRKRTGVSVNPHTGELTE